MPEVGWKKCVQVARELMRTRLGEDMVIRAKKDGSIPSRWLCRGSAGRECEEAAAGGLGRAYTGGRRGKRGLLSTPDGEDAFASSVREKRSDHLGGDTAGFYCVFVYVRVGSAENNSERSVCVSGGDCRFLHTPYYTFRRSGRVGRGRSSFGEHASIQNSLEL